MINTQLIYNIVVVIEICIILYIFYKTKVIRQVLEVKYYKKRDKTNIQLMKIFLILYLILFPTILIIYKKYILAFIVYNINIIMTLYIVKLLKNTDVDQNIELAKFINDLIKEFSIQTNITEVFQNALLESDGIFIRPIFQPMLDELIRNQDTDIFKKKLENCENLWVSSLLMILDDYTENSDRDIVINSLNELYDMMDIGIDIYQENKSKLNIMLLNNQIIMYIGVIVGSLLFVFNSFEREFFMYTIRGNVFWTIADILAFGSLYTIARMIKGFDY